MPLQTHFLEKRAQMSPFFLTFAENMADKDMTDRPLILITNDDGILAQGIQELTSLMCRLGDVVVVAPDGARSGMACAISAVTPVRLQPVGPQKPGLRRLQCSGTPVDCVKLALEQVAGRKPDLLVSGINHGDNASVSMHYSGTIGAVLEGCMKGIPSVGFSLRTRRQECDFLPYRQVVLDTVSYVLERGLPQDVCLNVNFPEVDSLQGVNVCRMARGNWVEEWEPADKDSFCLTGRFVNLEPEAEDTDYWALDHGRASITPLRIDATAYPVLAALKALES